MNVVEWSVFCGTKATAAAGNKGKQLDLFPVISKAYFSQ
jgi:hypothetical protein